MYPDFKEQLADYTRVNIYKPCFQIKRNRKFEICEICKLFHGEWLKLLNIGAISLYIFTGCLSFVTVSGTAWAVNIPFNFSGVEQCNGDNFINQTLPEEVSCRNAYWFCLFLFGCITVPLSLFELKEQAIIQMLLGLLRFIVIGAMVIFSVSNLAVHSRIWTCDDPWANDNFTVYNSDSDGLFFTKLSFRDWLLAIPVFVYGFILHQGIPTLTHPIKEKHLLWTYFTTLFVVLTILYAVLGITVAIWFRDCTSHTCTLNWVS